MRNKLLRCSKGKAMKTATEASMEILLQAKTKKTREALKKVLDFVERWNKQDKESDVAEAARYLGEYLIPPLF